MPFSTFGGIEIAKSSLWAHQQALNTTGHNIANANSEGYSRQVVTMGATSPLYPYGIPRDVTSGMMGTGVQVMDVERQRDPFIDARVTNESATLGYWDRQEELTHQIELIYNEPSDNSLRSVLDAFWSSLEDMSNNPENLATRAIVRERATAVTETLNHMYSQLQALGGSGGVGGGANAINTEVKTSISEINSYATEIAGLNSQIKNALGAGDNPNDLYDRRDYLVSEINKLVEAQVVDDVNGEYRVNVGGLTIVQGNNAHTLEFTTDPVDGKDYIYWEGKVKITPQDGAIKALFEVRDKILPYHFEMLNDFAIAFTDKFNEQHRAGFGLDGTTGTDFFEALPTQTTGIYKIIANPADMPPAFTYNMQENVPLDGDTATTAPENYESAVIGSGTLSINGYAIAYDCSVDSLRDICDRITVAQPGLVADIDPTGRMTLTATRDDNLNNSDTDYLIQGLSDTGNLLDRLGILTAGQIYNGTTGSEANLVAGATITRPPQQDAAYAFRLSDAIELSLGRIAAAGGDDTDLDGIGNVSLGPGNSDNALAMAALKNTHLLEAGTATFNDYYNAIIAKLGTDAQVAKTGAQNQDQLVTNLKNLQSEVSGVSLDEEMTNLMKFQRGFEAASRFIQIYDQMLDRIVNGLKTS